jgi:histidinol dehydrogenase
MVVNAEKMKEQIDNAGAIFMGYYTPEAVGDYTAGPSHVLPTGGSARFFSPLSPESFVKRTSLIGYNESRLKEEAKEIMILARLEGLEAHAKSVEVRLK